MESTEIKHSFEELKVSPEVMQAIKETRHKEMFPIQAEAIPKILMGKDIISQAQTGTGKTAAFAIPIAEKIHTNQEGIQAIILVPTRELAVQVNEEILKYGKYRGIKTLAVYGGVSIENQINIIREGIHVIVGTPGRVIDHLKRGTLNLGKIKFVVLDEADRMLDMGFIEDINFILETTPKSRQTLLFSATMPDAILKLADRYMKNHETISVSKDEITVKDIEQVYCDVDYYNKIDVLKKIIETENVFSAIIFCNTKAGVDKLAYILKKMKQKVEAIHGNLSQAKRNRVIENFKKGRIVFLIATDVAARGLDIQGVSHVINYNVPQEPQSYVHRIGRTGRAGKHGKAIMFVTDRDRESLGRIEWYIDMPIKKVDYGVPPSGKRPPKESSGGNRQQSYGRNRERRDYRGNRRTDDRRTSHGGGRNKYAFGNF